MKKTLIISILILATISSFGQKKYPVPVRPADTLVLVTQRGSYQLQSFSDTLWVFKNSQFQNALIKAKLLELCEKEVEEYKILVDVQKEKSLEQDSIIAVYIKDRDYYQKNWNTCEDDFDILTKKYKRNSIFKKLSMAAIPVAFAIGFFIAK